MRTSTRKVRERERQRVSQGLLQGVRKTATFSSVSVEVIVVFCLFLYWS